MITFVLNIIPKIKKYSQKLDNLVLLTNKPWVVLDELVQSKTVYIFRENNDLLISKNGSVTKGKWEYLMQNSILIDLPGQSYLLRHGFFDDNILALKIDSKDEYAVLINESKYNEDLNTIDSVINFLNEHYLLNPASVIKKINQVKKYITEMEFLNKGYNLRMGSFYKYKLKFNCEGTFFVYEKISNGKFYFHTNKEILIFQDKNSCLDYIESMLN